MRRVRKIINKIMLLLFVGLVAGLGYLGYKIHQKVETVMTF
ncbi:lysozyme family protein, partial [Enterococcus faecalis]